MTNPKTEHKIRKPTATTHPIRPAPVAAPERPPSASANMIEAFDRLGQKLDEVAGLFREQVEVWRQIRPPAAQAGPAAEPRFRYIETATPAPAATPQTGQLLERRREAAATLPDAPAEGGLAAMAEEANRLVDTLSHAGGGWPEQAAGVQQALESIMAHLENQAAAAPPKLDLEGIMSRLRDLEEQQQNMQSQFNNNRWGP
jgi:hypothetical protein